jgi:hypothetical protein
MVVAVTVVDLQVVADGGLGGSHRTQWPVLEELAVAYPPHPVPTAQPVGSLGRPFAPVDLADPGGQLRRIVRGFGPRVGKQVHDAGVVPVAQDPADLGQRQPEVTQIVRGRTPGSHRVCAATARAQDGRDRDPELA